MEDTLYELLVKGVIDEHFKILSADNTIISVSNQTTPLPGHPLTPMSAKSAPTQAQTISLFHPFLVSNQQTS